jgi:hypothetical protein
MNGPVYKNHQMKPMKCLMSLPLWCVLWGVSLAQVVSAANAVYQNDAVINYPVNVAYPPVIDATNFINNNSFTINFTSFSGNNAFYETSDTINYTNNGLMVVNTGFKFDTQSSSSGLHTMAGNFFNPGSITCGSVDNLGDIFAGGLFFVGGLPQCIVSATNIVNSGLVDVGVDGLIQLTGQNVDLSYSTLTAEGSGANAAGSGVFELDTNGWDPSFSLSQYTAQSCLISVGGFGKYILTLTNSTAYIDIASPDGTNNVIRAVFLQDTSGSNVVHNVYFNSGGQGVGGGNVTVEWVGSSQDPASGNNFNNYLYLNDDYALGSSTNVFLNGGGYPDNFTLTASTTPLPLGTPAAAGFLPIFPAGTTTNRYAYANVNLISTTVSTNTIPNHSITNLPGRIQISASQELNLSYAQITGPNYLSLKSTNQFDGSPGALIQSAYSDVNLGVTNGFLTISNLLSSQLPNWSGNVQAWSTRWLAVGANGVTNDFRVLIVGDQLTPTTLAQVQDLILHGTNSVIISDTLNVTRTLNIDAQNLTLTTNGPGVGATSLDGELNLNSSTILWQNSLPNVRNLTNNGAIRTGNQANFGNPLTVNITPGVAGITATGRLAQAGSANISLGDTVTIGASQYTFVNALQSGKTNQIKLASTFDASLNNLISAINHTAGSGSSYSTGTTTNPQVQAGVLAGHAFTVTASVAGTNGNVIVTTTTSTHLTWNSYATLLGGVNAIPAITNVVAFPYDNFVNHGLLSDSGTYLYAGYFENGGVITNGGVGSFILQSQTAVVTNGTIFANGDLSITANSLVTSNATFYTGRSLTLQVTNLLTDSNATNGNFWSVFGGSSAGLKLPIKPLMGDLRFTTITNTAQQNKNVVNTWAGQDRGVSVTGYTNNVAIGRLILDAWTNPPPNTLFTFNGASVSNAIYVDYLGFINQATNRDALGNMSVLSINTNMVIYYAQAVIGGVSVAEKINHKNNDRLRWVASYAGIYSSTNIVYGGMTNTVNAALAQSVTIDSDGDGIPNAFDPTPFFLSTDVNLALTITNVPTLKARLTWQTIPSATNVVYYSTNLASPWMVLTNFITPPAPPYSPINEILYDNPASMRFYQLGVFPNSVLYYGP